MISLAGHAGLDLAQLAGGHAAGDLPLLGAAGIVDLDVQQEAVELRFGQRVGAFLLERVLRGQHEERRGQLVHRAAGADLPLLHRLEHGRLRLGRRAVDLVGQQHVGEDRPGQKAIRPLPGFGIFLDHFGAGDVAGHQVGRELDALERQVQRLRPAS